VSDPLDDEFEDFGPPPRRRSRLLILLFCFVLLVVAISAFTSLWTDKLWFQSLGRTRVFDTLLATKSGLFLGFGLFMGLMVSVNIVVAYRARPMIRARTVEDDGLERYRDLITPSRRLLVALVGLVVALFGGGSALGQWRNYLMWANAQPFHKVDPWFHKDIGFYVFSLPWWHFVVNFVLTSVVVALLAALVTHYLYGGIRLQVSGERFGTAAQRHVCVLLGLLVLSKAASYYLGRFDLTTRNGSRFTGMSYARQHASLPAQDALIVIAVICALIFFLNLWRPSWLLPGVGVGLFVLTSILLGVIWPAIVQRFQVKPNEIDKEAPYIAANIKATRQAYGVAGVKVTSFPAKETLSRQAVAASATSLASVWLLDPSVVSSTFQQLQQVRGYYAVPPLLSVDRYPVEGDQRGLVLAARELNLAGLPQDKKKWSNEHTVYTHGYGMIAAYGDQLPAKGAATPARDVPGEPVWAEGDIPPKGILGDYQPRIYFGQYSPDYSIVGHSPNQPDFEVDYPASSGDSGNSTTTMYDGPGVPIGSAFHKILYALKFGDSSILLSSRVNDDSVLLYDRSPERRVAKVAPWLTLDSNPYPAVVDGRILWIIDGYTTSDRYAGSAKRSMSSMTSDSRSRSGLNTVPGDELNYIRNSVKATVDAYTGEVTLYAWDEADPILKAMEQAFPGQVEPKKDIPRDLLAHLRYPDDLFKVQRSILKDYHVLSPTTFFNDSDAWDLPNNPSVSAQQQPPYRLVVPPTPGAAPVYSLTSAYTPYDRQNLAAYLSVGSDPTQPATYGKLSILRLPDDSQVSGPDNVANLFNRSSAVTKRLQSYRMSRAKVVYGNLLSMPVDSSSGGGMLYVEPMYALRSKGSGNFPVLAFVMVSDGNRVGVGETLAGALGDMFGDHKKVTSPGTSEPSGSLTKSEISLLQQASAEFTKADNALRKQDLTGYARHVERARELVQKALADSRANPAEKKATMQ
jgi:uncharacterized membrane protein (UPF0182 family)